MISPRYKFADFVLDVREETLSKNGESLNLRSRTFQILQCLVENAGKIVTKEEFFERVWQGAAVEDNNLTVAVAQIRKVLDETKDNKFIETVTKKGYRFVAEVEKMSGADEIAETVTENDENALIGGEEIPATLTAGEQKPSQQKKAQMRSGVAALIASHRILAAVAFGSIVFLIAAFWRQNVAPVKAEPLHSIAVLPFATENNSPENQLFAEKLTRDLTQNLGRLTDVRVSAYEAVETYQEFNADLAKIETELKIDGTVNGTIRTDGTATEIEIKINDLRTGAKIWEKRYWMNVQNLPESQYLIARDAAREIGQSKQLQSPVATANFEAYQGYLAGRHFLDEGSSKDLAKAVEYFTAATVKDSSFADAYSGLAVAHIVQGLDLYASKGLNASRQSFPAAAERAKRALELDPQSGEAFAALAFVNYRYEYNWTAAEQNFKRAINLNPNNILAHRWYGGCLHRGGRSDDGLREQKTALALAPNSARILNEMAWGAYLAHRFDEAVGYADNAQKIDETNAAGLYNASEIYENKGDFVKAFELWRDAMIIEEANPKWIANLEESFKKDGSRGFIKAKTEWLENLAEKDYIFPTDLAKCYIALGEKEKAVGWLEKGVEARVPDILSIKYAPAFDSVRNDARFQAVLAKMNFPN